MNASTAQLETCPAATPAVEETPPFRRTYALAYAIGAMWLAVEIPLLGFQEKYAFSGLYMFAFVLPPFLTALGVLIADPVGRARSLPWRWLVLSLVASVASVISTVVLTPFLILMFREGVGRDLSLTGALSAVTLGLAVTPVVLELVRVFKQGRIGHAVLLVGGLLVTAIALAMALAPGGALATSMRLDQAQLLMITSSWWLPVYAAAAAAARRAGMA